MAGVKGRRGATAGGSVPLWVRARGYTDEALGTLVKLMRSEETPANVRVGCAAELLNRAWGKAPIMIAGDEERPIRVNVTALGPGQLDELENLLLKALGEGISAVPRLNKVVREAPLLIDGAMQQDILDVDSGGDE